VLAASVSCSAAASRQATPGGPAAPSAPVPATFSVLVFSKTAGFRHDSIPAGIAAIRQLGQQLGFAVQATEDAGVFADASLTPYKAVVFLSTTGDVLDEFIIIVFADQWLQAAQLYRNSTIHLLRAISRVRKRSPFCHIRSDGNSYAEGASLSVNARTTPPPFIDRE